MGLAPVPAFLTSVKAHLRRSEWEAFPEVVIHAEESPVKKHPLYVAAKGGNATAAETLVFDSVSIDSMNRMAVSIGSERPRLLPVHALEAEGMNIIPRVLAQLLGRMLNLPVEKGIVQSNYVRHTGAGGWQRIASPALFNGNVNQAKYFLAKYFLVDDFIGQGGTLANLKGFVESHGAQVIGATTLTGKAYSAQLGLSNETLRNLRGKYGTQLEEWWLAAFGYGFERLTESEARYLIRADDADTIATRIIAAGGG